MASVTASTQILAGRRIYIDANVFIYLLDGTTRWAAPATSILAAARAGQFAAVTGEAVVAEVMVGPYRSRDPMLIRSARELFALPRLVEVVGHPAKVWDDAAMLRGTLDVPLIDGLHVATAAAAGCDCLVTNDRRMRPALGVDVVPLADLL
jgi:predicted nucleic acid-binding protein